MKYKEIMTGLLFNKAMLVLVLTFTLSGCKGKDNDVPDDPIPPTDSIIAKVYLTRGDQIKLFNNEGKLLIKAVGSTNWPVIVLDTAVRFQSIEGYGAALTGSSAYLLNRKMTATARAALLTDLFDPQAGIGISYLRLTIGASDFSLSNFSYDDRPIGQNDFNLEHFSMSQDTLDVIPMAKEILGVYPEMTYLGSPWSPPRLDENRWQYGRW